MRDGSEGNIERYEVRQWADGWSVHDAIGAASIRRATCARQEDAEKIARALNNSEGAVEALREAAAALDWAAAWVSDTEANRHVRAMAVKARDAVRGQ